MGVPPHLGVPLHSPLSACSKYIKGALLPKLASLEKPMFQRIRVA